MWALRIYPNNGYDEIKSVLEQINMFAMRNEKIGLDIAFYGNPSTIENSCFWNNFRNEIKDLPLDQKIAHSYLQDGSFHLLGLKNEKAIGRIKFESDFCNYLNIKKTIAHTFVEIDRERCDGDYDNEINLFEKIALGVNEFNRHGFIGFLEKTYEPLDWFKDLFKYLLEQEKVDKIGFCLDTGHTRVWHQNSLDNWLDFTKEIAFLGFGTHFHIHTNDTKSDSHIPLDVAFNNKLLESSVLHPNGFLSCLKRIKSEHVNSLWTLETGPVAGIKTLAWLKSIGF